MMRVMQKKRVFYFFLVILSLLALFNSQPALAQNPKPTPSDNDVNRVAKQMFCPVCENIPLDVCPTQACSEWRELIRQKLSEGWTDEQIKQYFATQYGDRVLAEPPRRGLNWLVYLIPAVFFALGVYIVYRVISGMRRGQPAADAPASLAPTAEDDPYLKELEEELKKNT
jgi:cytochrome c-type biogenesis protein CcmH